MAASYRYDANGNTLNQSGSLASANVYRFSSKAICEDTFWGVPPLYYYGYRWYVPNLQLWMNRDPIDEEGESISTALLVKIRREIMTLLD